MALNERNAGNASGDAERDPRLDRLYRNAAREAPPARLDAAILAAARREAHARPRSLSTTLRRWHVPVSIAAVVIVSVSLIILVREEGGEQIVPAPAVAPTAEQPAAPALQSAPAKAAREAAQSQAAAPAPPRRESRDDASVPAALGKLADSARPEPGQPEVSGAGAVVTPESGVRPLPQPFLAAPRVAEERAPLPPAEAGMAGRIAGAPAAATEPQAANSALDAPQSKSMARALAAKPPEQDRLPVWHAFEKEPPQKWLARIEELRGQGRAAEADEMLSEFKRRFPGHPLHPGSK